MSEIIIEEQVLVMTPAAAVLTPVVEQVTLSMDTTTGSVNVEQTVLTANLTNPQPVTLQIQTSSIIGEVAGGPPGEKGEKGDKGDPGDGASVWTKQTITAAGTTSITAGTLKQIEVDCTAGNITIQLPSVADMLGEDIRIKRMDNSANLITVLPAGGQTLEFDSSWELYSRGECLQINAQTGGWRIV